MFELFQSMWHYHSRLYLRNLLSQIVWFVQRAATFEVDHKLPIYPIHQLLYKSVNINFPTKLNSKIKTFPTKLRSSILVNNQSGNLSIFFFFSAKQPNCENMNIHLSLSLVLILFLSQHSSAESFNGEEQKEIY